MDHAALSRGTASLLKILVARIAGPHARALATSRQSHCQPEETHPRSEWPFCANNRNMSRAMRPSSALASSNRRRWRYVPPPPFLLKHPTPEPVRLGLSNPFAPSPAERQRFPARQFERARVVSAAATRSPKP